MLHYSDTLSNNATLLAAERPRLVRLCSRLTGRADVAEDLAQETLLEAWRQRHKLTDPSGLAQWLSAIARIVCLRWARRQGRAGNTLSLLVDDDPTLTKAAAPSEADSLEAALEREELVALLDQALATLPSSTRHLLVLRYVRELPVAEIAAREDISADAAVMRLARARAALRELLTTRFRDEAIAHGLVAPDDDQFTQTRIWCPRCGSCRLHGRLGPDQPLLLLRCPHCDGSNALHVSSTLDALAAMNGYKPALTRVLSWIHTYYHERAIDGTVSCQRCGRRLRIQLGAVPAGPSGSAIFVWCDQCQTSAGTETWWSLAQSVPAVQHFWRAHGRIRALPQRTITFAGQPAICTRIESVTSAAAREVVHLRDPVALAGVFET